MSRKTQKIVRNFTRPELDRVLNNLNGRFGLRNRALIRFGIATGRPYDEIMIPLKSWGLFHFFDPEHIATHREIAEAEEFLKRRGRQCSIAKPHPYV